MAPTFHPLDVVAASKYSLGHRIMTYMMVVFLGVYLGVSGLLIGADILLDRSINWARIPPFAAIGCALSIFCFARWFEEATSLDDMTTEQIGQFSWSGEARAVLVAYLQDNPGKPLYRGLFRRAAKKHLTTSNVVLTPTTEQDKHLEEALARLHAQLEVPLSAKQGQRPNSVA